jgi:hypothetical protein
MSAGLLAKVLRAVAETFATHEASTKAQAVQMKPRAEPEAFAFVDHDGEPWKRIRDAIHDGEALCGCCRVATANRVVSVVADGVTLAVGVCLDCAVMSSRMIASHVEDGCRDGSLDVIGAGSAGVGEC